MEYSLFFLVLFLIAAASVVWWSLKNHISPMPTSRKCKKALFELIPAGFEGKVYELGSGWGSLLAPLSKTLRTSSIIGYETSLIPYWFSRLRAAFSFQNNVTVSRKDFFTMPLHDADLVICYLYPEAMRKLAEKFEKELKPGTLIISNTFSIPGWDPVKKVRVQDLYHTNIYLYIFLLR